jgi:dihydroorotate dehydrogenase
MALNAVGLSNHGAQAHLSFHFQGRKHWPQWMSKNTPRWQARRKPFFLSYAMTESSPEDHLPALGNFLHVLGKELFSFPHLRETVGLQLNLSCPNTEHGIELLEEEGIKALDMVRVSGISIPVVLKLSVTTPVTTAVKLALHPACNAIIVSNTLKWGEIPEKINWKKLFGTDISPLAHFGGGGLSGRPLLPLLLEWLEEAKRVGFPKPINAGGGILGPKDVDEVFGRGAQGISLGSIVMLRPWRMTKTIARAHVLARQHARKRGR